MNTVDDLARVRLDRLTEANRCVDLLCEMIDKHAEAVNGRDRKELNDLAADAAKKRDAINIVLAAGPEAVMRVGTVDLTEALREIAMAGAVALQILGGRLARGEG